MLTLFMRFFYFLLGLLLFAGATQAANYTDYYELQDIATPPDLVPECGGISFLPDGRLVAVFHHGEVYFYEPQTKTWKLFAQGIHDPMGVLAISPREILVTQRPEITRLTDSTGAGVADGYECFSDVWGLSGNYHEFAMGIVRDKEGNFYVPVSNGSNGSVPRYEVRGRFNPDGYVETSHFSAVPYRGWILKFSPEGKMTPVACGFRQPNGLVLDPQGRLFCTDNQGDWVGTSKLFHVEQGKFYGHAPSLAWREDFKKGRTLEELDKMRTEGSVLFPHAILANSPGQPVVDQTGGKFGPFAGQMIVTEFNIPRLLRVMLEEVHGQVQGATTTFFEGGGLRAGNHRLAFAPDGSLWVAQSERKQGWPAGAGIQRLVWKGETPLDVSEMHLTDTGFEFAFTKPVDPASVNVATAYQARRYYYQYHEEYGSPQTDIHPVGVKAIQVSPDGKRVKLDVDALTPGYIYEFTLHDVKAADGTPLLNKLICYTVNTLRDGSVAPVPRPPVTGKTEGSGKDKPKATGL